MHVVSHLAEPRDPKDSKYLPDSRPFFVTTDRFAPLTQVNRSIRKRLCGTSPTPSRTMLPFCRPSEHSNTTSSASLQNRLALRRETSRELRRLTADRSRPPSSSRAYRTVLPHRAVCECRLAGGSETPNQGWTGLGIRFPRYLHAACEHLRARRVTAPHFAICCALHPSRSQVRESHSHTRGLPGRALVPTPWDQAPSRTDRSRPSRAVQGGHPISAHPCCATPRRALRVMGARCELGCPAPTLLPGRETA